tara:strand:- start:57 stop:500 length:444 start_codon:yes stop_codon:yes gene_type:complete
MKHALLTLLMIASFSFGYCQKDNIARYNSISDSLAKYQSSPFISGVESLDSIVQDYIELDYNSFKRKYDLTDEDMEETAHALKVTYEIAKVNLFVDPAIEKFDSTFNDVHYDTLEINREDMFTIDTLDINMDTLKMNIRSYKIDTIR